MNCEPAKQFELVERMLAARKQLVGAQSDKMDFYTNRCDGLDRQVDAAEKPGRDWIGIDVTQLAISLIKNRLLDTYGRRMKFVSGPEGRDASPRRPGSGHVADVSLPKEIPHHRRAWTTPLKKAPKAKGNEQSALEL